MNKSCCHIALFGGLRVLADDETRLIADEIGPATAPRLPHRVSALLAFLALRLGTPQPREIIAERLWAEQSPALARNSLSATLSLLRRHLVALDALTPAPDGIFIVNRDQIALNPGLVTTDVAAFEAVLGEAEQVQNGKGAASPHVRALLLEKAIARYRGELLPGYYEDWIVREQERLSERYADALRRLAHCWETAGDMEAAARAAQKAVDADPFAEDAQLTLIRLLAISGRTPAALAAYARFETLLQKEFGIAPSDAARRLLMQVRDGLTSAIEPPLPPSVVSSAPTPPPLQTTPSVTATPESPEIGGPVGGVVPLDSPFYITRPTDARFFAAIRRRDSIVLVKGARQVGKTSLLARGLQQARESGARVVLTDFDALGDSALRSADSLFKPSL